MYRDGSQPTGAGATLPPGPGGPALVSGLRYARDPIGFFVRAQRRYGDMFSVSFPYFGRVVYVADPAIVKEVFAGDPSVFHAGEANASVLEPALGPQSVLTLDDDERVVRYGALIREITERDMERWPVGRPFAIRPHTQRITLAVILRAVFGI